MARAAAARARGGSRGGGRAPTHRLAPTPHRRPHAWSSHPSTPAPPMRLLAATLRLTGSRSAAAPCASRVPTPPTRRAAPRWARSRRPAASTARHAQSSAPPPRIRSPDGATNSFAANSCPRPTPRRCSSTCAVAAPSLAAASESRGIPNHGSPSRPQRIPCVRVLSLLVRSARSRRRARPLGGRKTRCPRRASRRACTCAPAADRGRTHASRSGQ